MTDASVEQKYEPMDDNYMAEKLGIQDRIGFIKKVYGILSV